MEKKELDKKRFLDFAESLKLVRRTRIEDFTNETDIDDIYTDLLPKNGIITKVNLPRTTILVGRKGTGKSTIFQKSQKDLVRKKNCISIYIDVKSLYENSTPMLPEDAKALRPEFHRYLLYTNLIKEIIIETKGKLDEFVKGSIMQRILGFDHDQILRINQQLENIESSINSVIKTVDGSLIQAFKQINQDKSAGESELGISASMNPKAKLSISNNSSTSVRTEFESVLVRYLDIKKCLIENLVKIRDILSIDHLYVFLDDYSEIDEEAQRIFMDWFIAPLNNLSSDFVKFKVAVYPHRFYYGKLDNSKIDEISLDFFDAFYNFEKKVDISKMETLALDYTKRLLNKRLKIFFPENDWSRFFALEKEALFDLLLSVSFNVPRKIGYILSYCYESCLIHDLKISKDAIENASQRYYTDVVLKYFIANQFVSKPFKDKISNEHQFQLLEKIIERQQTNSMSRSRVKGKPTNHFVVNKSISSLLDNLELNGFITTYNNVYDSNSQLSVIYSLDYGLCKRHGLGFARAKDAKLVNYFANARFNMNVLITDYFNKTQVIRCSSGHEFPYNMLESLRLFSMKCPKCIESNVLSRCEVAISNEDIKEQLQAIERSKVKDLSINEYLVLDYLKTIAKQASNETISKALDKSSATAKVTMNKLSERGFVKLDEAASKKLRKDIYLITEAGDRLVTKINELVMKISAEMAKNLSHPDQVDNPAQAIKNRSNG